MNYTQINSLFTLFSSETDTEKYQPLIESAVEQVSRQLKEDADETDVRLCYLCAAIANYRYSQITCVKNKVAYTYAGTADKDANSQLEYDLARELMNEYYMMAADLLADKSFVFTCMA
jgi:hypothetical protein